MRNKLQIGLPGSSPGVTTRPDFLSDLLSALQLDESGFCLFEFGDPWAVEIDHLPLATSWTVLEGSLWVLSEDREPMEFCAGDTFFWPHGIVSAPYVIALSPDSPPMPARDFWQEAQLQGFEIGKLASPLALVRWNQDNISTRALSMVFGIKDRHQNPLITALPEFLFVRSSEPEAEFINAVMHLILDEQGRDLPGLGAIASEVAKALSLCVIRAYALSPDKGVSGWLAGLGDRHIARALAVIHRDPDHMWTVDGLASVAGLSRSLFMERFLACVGQTPKRYLRAWRMHLAREALADGTSAIGTLATKLGYRSEAAFRSAFRNVTGQPPREFRRHAETETVPKLVDDISKFWGIYARLQKADALDKPANGKSD